MSDITVLQQKISELEEELAYLCDKLNDLSCDFADHEAISNGPKTSFVFVETCHPDARPPVYATPGAAGFDLTSTVDMTITRCGGQAIVPTGLKMALPDGCELQIRPRSGLAAKHGVTVLNAPGTVDSDYRGEIGVVLINHSHVDFTIKKGDRIAQGVLARVERALFALTPQLDETVRGAGGFGSTGK